MMIYIFWGFFLGAVIGAAISYVLTSHYYEKVIDELQSENAELKEELRWRKYPEEKPELGDVVLVKFTERTKGHYYPIDVVRWDSTYELGEIEVSHWMPRPSDPKEEA